MKGCAVPVLALDLGLDAVAGDRRYLDEMLGCFLVDLEGYLSEIHEAACRGDTEAWRVLVETAAQRAERLGALALTSALRRPDDEGWRGLQGCAGVQAEALRLQGVIAAPGA